MSYSAPQPAPRIVFGNRTRGIGNHGLTPYTQALAQQRALDEHRQQQEFQNQQTQQRTALAQTQAAEQATIAREAAEQRAAELRRQEIARKRAEAAAKKLGYPSVEAMETAAKELVINPQITPIQQATLDANKAARDEAAEVRKTNADEVAARQKFLDDRYNTEQEGKNLPKSFDYFQKGAQAATLEWLKDRNHRGLNTSNEEVAEYQNNLARRAYQAYNRQRGAPTENGPLAGPTADVSLGGPATQPEAQPAPTFHEAPPGSIPPEEVAAKMLEIRDRINNHEKNRREMIVAVRKAKSLTPSEAAEAVDGRYIEDRALELEGRAFEREGKISNDLTEGVRIGIIDSKEVKKVFEAIKNAGQVKPLDDLLYVVQRRREDIVKALEEGGYSAATVEGEGGYDTSAAEEIYRRIRKAITTKIIAQDIAYKMGLRGPVQRHLEVGDSALKARLGKVFGKDLAGL